MTYAILTYVPKRPPRAKQAEALDRLVGRRHFALLMAMRTGKTKVVLDDFGRLVVSGELDDLLVVAPAGVYRTWPTAVEEDVADDLGLSVLLWSAGSDGKKARNRLEDFMASRNGPRLLLVNVEALSNVDRARDLCADFLSQRRSMFAIDESTVIKNPSAKRTKYVCRELGPRAKYRRIMSGLPTPRSPLDAYAQFYFLDRSILGFSNYYSFRARYAVMRTIMVGGRRTDVVVGYRNEEELREKIAPHSFRCLLSDCYDLPPKTYSVRNVEMTKEQKKMYDELKKFSCAAIESGGFVSASQTIVQILRMHQVLCGHVADEEGVFRTVPEKRTQALLDLLDEHDGKAIVWCSYGADVEKLSKAIEAEFGAGTVSRFWGGNVRTREDEEKKFQMAPGRAFMIATPGAGGRGRRWDMADLVVYYSSTNDLEHRDQSEERAQGVGKDRSVLYVDLLVPGTVDEKIVGALRKKIDMATMINGDNWREWLI